MPEKKILLQHCGAIDPRNIQTYIDRGGFAAWEKARNQMTPESVVTEIKASGLKGRGGAGFPCGVKWELARNESADQKYLICNADEGEVGAFKDRHLLTHDPFTLIEGMTIAAYAIGAREAYIYLRAEYHFLLDDLKNAINQAGHKGFLQDVTIHIHEGAGAYICGEESALMDSIEGKRGEARFRPPFPPSKGLWGKPTIINNVETLATVPHIIANGAAWFSQIGTDQSKGTKLFSISGDVAKPGVYELVLGSTLKELVIDMAGAKKVRWVQVGGATGGIVPLSMITTPLAYETVLGSGSVMVFDETREILDFVSRTMEFLAEESCGKCTPCREGTEAMLYIVERLAQGDGQADDVQALEDLSETMMLSSLCGLGQAAAIPVRDTIRYFRNDYETRIKQAVLLRGLSGKF
ncbi:MAG: NADH-quinone oxidoreductase subunit L [Desulfobacteraceae bacterium]|nr:NADH-quinone oxidoreductase subunit L [Desulfobacteraceae bacterium]